MKNSSLLVFALVLCTFNTFAQLNCKTRTTADSTIKTCYHQNKMVSTIECWDKNRYWGNIKGFNNRGQLLFEFHLRRVAGHASAHVSHYTNGQVSKVAFSTHPDGGIQWYAKAITFDEKGNKTGESEDGTDDFGRPLLRGVLPATMDTTRHKPVKPIPQETVVCAVPYFSILQVENETKYPLVVQVKGRTMDDKEKTFTLMPGTKIRPDSVMQAQFFEQPDKSLTVKVNWKSPRRRGTLMVQKELPVNLGKTRSLYRWVVKQQ